MIEKLAVQIAKGQRMALAKAITLAESTRSDHQKQCGELFNALKNYPNKALRIGISGPPGVGKSTFMEAFGSLLINEGHKIAVLAIDPSSQHTGGSILGDKTRMPFLSNHLNAFVRPSPSHCNLGGVARGTRSAILFCAMAGFDIIFIETVGVGQSETMVADMVDVFILLASPTGGDELQAIKRGITELADIIVVTKADGNLTNAANFTSSDLRQAFRLMRPKFSSWQPEVYVVSAINNIGLTDVWQAIERFYHKISGDLEFVEYQKNQVKRAIWHEVESLITTLIKSDKAAIAAFEQLESQVYNNQTTPFLAAQQLLKAYRQE